MHISLAVTEGPNTGLLLPFDRHDMFVVGRSQRTSTRLPAKDPYLSRFHFMLEANPPRVRVMDLNSHNGTFVNGQRIATPTEIHAGDRIKAGHSVFTAQIEPGEPSTVTELPKPPAEDVTREYTPENPPEAPTTVATNRYPSRLSLPGYRIVREVGFGGMGTVFEAERQADSTTVAIKVVRPSVVPTRKQIERFLREADILRQLDHPSIVRFHETGEAGGMLYFAMEFVPGMDARQYVKDKGTLSVPAATQVCVKVLQGLSHAHARGFVHRDVKPSNILMGQRAGTKVRVKLADFGLARVYEESNMSGMTMTGEIGGSPAFMPPEQILDFRNVGPPADIYGTAATLYFLLTGAFIYDLPEDPVAAFGLVLDGNPIPIRQRNPKVSERIANIIDKGLAKDPSDRFAAAEEMVQALTPM
jgi:serine/threonine-protein kinase